MYLDSVPCYLKTFSSFGLFFMAKLDITNLFIALISGFHIFIGNQKVIASMSRFLVSSKWG